MLFRENARTAHRIQKRDESTDVAAQVQISCAEALYGNPNPRNPLQLDLFRVGEAVVQTGFGGNTVRQALPIAQPLLQALSGVEVRPSRDRGGVEGCTGLAPVRGGVSAWEPGAVKQSPLRISCCGFG